MAGFSGLANLIKSGMAGMGVSGASNGNAINSPANGDRIANREGGAGRG